MTRLELTKLVNDNFTLSDNELNTILDAHLDYDANYMTECDIIETIDNYLFTMAVKATQA